MDYIHSQLLSSAFFILGIFIALQLRRYINSRFSPKYPNHNIPPTPPKRDPYQDIEPLTNFDWKTEPPIRNAPLKPKYHLTMSIETISLSDLIVMDSTYLHRLAIRRELISAHHPATIQCNPPCRDAVYELYTWIFATLLPRRFPSIYTLTPDGAGLLNTATSTTIPLRPPPDTPQAALQILGENVDTDFLLLLPRQTSTATASATAEGAAQMPTYYLEAFVTCFPTGFSTREKLGQPLALIHAPVPGYHAKLERSMDRFFARLPVGTCVKRGNWSLTTNPDLFAERGNHLYADGKTETDGREKIQEERKEDLEAEIERQKSEVVIEDCRLRSERQTLFRLPESKAIVFSFKTYQYTLEEVKRDGYAEQLAEAMEGLRRGNVPEMDFYKRGVVWREPAIRYLRS